MCDAKRLRQREQQSTSLFSKNNNNNKNFARAAHFLYISLPLLLQREASQLDFLGRKCVVSAHRKKQKTAACVPVHVSFFLFIFLLFTVAHFHVAGHQHFSFSHHRYKIFMFFFSNEIRLLCFSSLAVALGSCFVAYFLVFSDFFYFPNL